MSFGLNKYKFIFLILLIKCGVINGYSQEYSATVFLPKDGLASYNIKHIQQDKYGFIWVGTQGGVSFYDGNSFSKVASNYINGSEDVAGLKYDAFRNWMWIAYSYGGIEAIDCNSHKSVFQISQRNSHVLKKYPAIATFELVDSSRLVVGLKNVRGGIGYFFCDIKNRQESGFCKIADSTADKNEISCIAAKYGSVYFFVNGVGVCSLKPNHFDTVTWVTRDTTEEYKACLFDQHQKIWFAGKKGISCFGPVKNEIFSYPVGEKVNDMVLADGDTLLLATENGCKSISLQNGKISIINFRTDRDIAYKSNYIISCFLDNRKRLWLGYSEFLLNTAFQMPVFTKVGIDKKASLSLNHLYNILPVNEGEFFLADLKGLYYANSNLNSIRKIDTTCGIPTNVSAYKSKYVIYNTRKGFFAYDRKAQQRVNIVNVIPEFALIKKRVVEKWIDFNDSVSVLSGSDDKGLIIWNKVKHTIKELEYSKVMGWEDKTVNSLTKLSDSEIIVNQDRCIGIYNINTAKIRSFSLPMPGGADTARYYFDCLLTPENIVILAYGYGVFMLDYRFNVKKVINKGNGLSDNGVYCVLKDKQGFIWVSTNNGLNRIDSKSYAVQNYYEDDGLINNAFEENSGCLYNGKLYFGGLGGFTEVAAENIRLNLNKPKVVITAVKYYNQGGEDTTAFNVGGRVLYIPNNVSQAIIYFASDNLLMPQRNEYFYKIEGLQKQWFFMGNENKISLIGLNPGRYKLYIKTSNNSGISSDSPIQVEVYVLPKWYQTLWFDFAVAMAVIGLLYGFFRYRISQLKKQQQIRSEIASDLHDDIGSALNTVKVFTHLAKRDEDKMKHINQIEDSVTQAAVGLRDMLWILDDSQDTVQEMLERIKKFALPVAMANGIALECINDAASDSLQISSKTKKRNLLLIAKESINNSIKYADCKNITVTLSQKSNKVTLVIKDDGKGFDMVAVQKGYGLNNIVLRAKQIKAIAEIESSPGQGTRVTVRQ